MNAGRKFVAPIREQITGGRCPDGEIATESNPVIDCLNKVLEFLTDETKWSQGGDSSGEFENLKLALESCWTIIKGTQWGAKLWLTKATTAVRQAELVMEKYHLQHRPQRGFNSFIRKLKVGDGRAAEIRHVIKELQEIKEGGNFYGFPILQEGSTKRNVHGGLPETVPCFFKEKELLGIKSKKEELVNVLLGEPSTRLVISLVGIAGVGKTTLASVVYQSQEVKNHFDCHAWIDVSQSYNFRNLFNHLARMICPEEMDTKPAKPIDYLYQDLFYKRYVIVFDGVWQPDFFQFLNIFLPENNSGSRIVITTRDNAIAASCDMIHTLQPLSEDKARKLFLKSASVHDCTTVSEVSSLEIVRICHGLPLVIWAMGDIMSTHLRATPENFKDEIGENPSQIEEVSRIFYHGYDDLPYHIKLCLLYFGIYPKDYLIPDVKLVKLWIAEGFVREETDKTLEQVAETYLNELTSRNLVQVSHINYDGTERLCGVHGFMHHIISARAKRYKICQVLNKTPSRILVNDQVRRLSIYGDAVNTFEMTTERPDICSVLLFDVNEIEVRRSFVLNLFESFKFLELLDFENAALDDLPNEVGNLSLLKYLSLRNTTVKKLPKSVGRLLNLQTLDVRNTLMRELPIQIQKLRKLRHLLASRNSGKTSLDSVHGVQIKEGIGCLENLQTLMTVEAHRSSLGVIEELEKLRHLRCLSVSKLTTDMVNTLCSFIEKMNLLESLSLYLSTDGETFDLESVSSPPPLLRRLILKDRLEKLPDWILELRNLNVLGLSFSQLAADPLKALQCLPNLKFLWLHRAYDGEQLHFEGICFQKLRQLVLTELHELRTIKIERGALPLLEELRLGLDKNDLTLDIQNLKNLQVLECYDMSDEFVLGLQPEGGSDYWKVKHVPSVVFRYRIRGSLYASYKLGEAALLDRLTRLERSTSNVELYGRQLSFFYNDDEELARTSNAEWSDQYSDFTDDVEF